MSDAYSDDILSVFGVYLVTIIFLLK